MAFERYVAIGDSTSEGLDDPDGRGGYRGWANRLAERLVALQGSVLYANLAIRGRTTRQIRDEQLARAVSMRPDLATVSAGMNDLLRPRFDAEAYAGDVETMQRALVDAGAKVLMFTLPDLGPVLPLARPLRARQELMNDMIRRSCARSGAILCDLAITSIGSDPRLWSDDRLHANSEGHRRIAEALAYHLGLPGTDDAWSAPLPDAPRATFKDTLRAELAWTRTHMLPWVWRHVRGKSSGDGRTAKRPELAPFVAS